jgi:hypothetical protein
MLNHRPIYPVFHSIQSSQKIGELVGDLKELGDEVDGEGSCCSIG